MFVVIMQKKQGKWDIELSSKGYFAIGNDELTRNGPTRAECPRCHKILPLQYSVPPNLEFIDCPEHGDILVGIEGRSVWKLENKMRSFGTS